MHLTKRQSEVLKFISSWNVDKGYPPSLSEISQHFNFASTNTVRGHLKALEQKGYIHISPGKARGIQVVSKDHLETDDILDSIPILGTIAAGQPIWAQQNMTGCIPVSPAFFGKGNMFALIVCGDSMINAGIFDKDIAVIRQQFFVENGEIAAVCINEDITLKRFYIEETEIILKAENDSYQDMIFDRNTEISIVGKMQGILRRGVEWC